MPKSLRPENQFSLSSDTTGTPDAVTVVSAPDEGIRRLLKTLTIYNADTASDTFQIQIDKNGTPYRVSTARTIAAGAEDSWVDLNDGLIVLDQDDESIQVLRGAAASTNEAEYTAHYVDEE